MPFRDLLNRLDAILTALNMSDEIAGLQIVDASALIGSHHPPLNPDWPALLIADFALDLAVIKAVLLNQYPPDHTLRTVSGESTQTLPLATLDTTETAIDALYIPALPQASSFERFQETIAHLRNPDVGCPWDIKQTHESLRPYLLEETYEVLDALDSGNRDDLREELGDLLLQIVLHSQIAVDEGTFRMVDVIAGINAKIIRRHPHVWGDVNAEDENTVKANWDQIKKAEKAKTRESRLDGVSKSLPALSQAFSYQDRAARVRFDWETIEPVIAKVFEEIEEINTAPDHAEREKEMGDLLFAVVNWARWLKIDPEAALRDANRRFYQRFHYIEQAVDAQQREFADLSLDEMDGLWEAAKSNGL